MAGSWPGQWHDKSDSDDSLISDNGLLFLSSDESPESYLWYESEGHDVLTQLGR